MYLPTATMWQTCRPESKKRSETENNIFLHYVPGVFYWNVRGIYTTLMISLLRQKQFHPGEKTEGEADLSYP